MAIRAHTLSVRDYRNFNNYNLELSDGVNILVGRNAAGKTNLIEALHLLTSGNSFRGAKVEDLLKESCDQGEIKLLCEGDGRSISLQCFIKSDTKANQRVSRHFQRNGKKVTSSGVRGVLPSVVFCPDHLNIIKGSSKKRRSTLDELGIQLSESYASLLQAYKKTLEQRNALLKEGIHNSIEINIWDEALIQTGVSIVLHRSALLKRISKYLKSIYSSIAPTENICVSYITSITPENINTQERESLENSFRQALTENFISDSQMGYTTKGPHRDDIVFTINNRSIRAFGSQGQQRSAVIAWKIAEVEVIKEILGYPPLLLLDDVMSELDEARRAAMLSFINNEIQTVITTTNLDYFSSSLLKTVKVVEING